MRAIVVDAIHQQDLRPHLDPLFCRGTGAYPSEVAEFCATMWQPHATFKISKPTMPRDLDAVAWIESGLEDGYVGIHEDATVYHGVAAILAGRGRRVNLLANSQMGTFVELDTRLHLRGETMLPDQVASAIVSPLTAYDRSAIICLIRHKLLRWYGSELNGPPSNNYLRECSAYFDSSAGQICAVNAVNGRAYRIHDAMAALDISSEILKDNGDSTAFSDFLLALCEAGILRRLAV